MEKAGGGGHRYAEAPESRAPTAGRTPPRSTRVREPTAGTRTAVPSQVCPPPSPASRAHGRAPLYTRPTVHGTVTAHASRAAIGRYSSTCPPPPQAEREWGAFPLMLTMSKLGTGATRAGATTRQVGGGRVRGRPAFSPRGSPPPPPSYINAAVAARSRPTENEASCRRGRPLRMRQTQNTGVWEVRAGVGRVSHSRVQNDGDPSPASSPARRAGGSRSGSRHRSRAAWRCPPPACPVRPAGGVVAGGERWCAGLGRLWRGPHCWQQPLPRNTAVGIGCSPAYPAG